MAEMSGNLENLSPNEVKRAVDNITDFLHYLDDIFNLKNAEINYVGIWL